jgi:hypothetical protein
MKKLKQCKNCQKEFIPKPAQARCDTCLWKAEKDKKFQQLKKQIEKPLKPPKKIKQKIDEKQKKINAIVRERDKGKPCISCGKKSVRLEAGHYISRAKSIKMRYDLDNIHGQCWECNNVLHGNEEGFKKGLIARYGQKYLENLDNRLLKESEILVKQ